MKHIVVDLEMNKILNNSGIRKLCSSETIEIGAVMLDDDLHEIAAFRTYIKPEYSNGINKDITKLTGITDAMVAKAPNFNEALKMFTNWCLGTGNDVKIYAWSTSDYIQISKEMALKDYEMTEDESMLLSEEWSDFQHEFDENLGFERQVSLKTALEMAGIDFSGKEHDALDDARNTADLFHVFKDKELFDETLRKIKEAMIPTPINCALGDLFDFSKFVFEQ